MEFTKSVLLAIISAIAVYLIVFFVMPECGIRCDTYVPPECKIGSLFGLIFVLLFLISVIRIIIIAFGSVIGVIKNDKQHTSSSKKG